MIFSFVPRRKPISTSSTITSRSRAAARNAIGYIRRIRAWCDKLKVFPEAGRLRDDLRPGVRILGFERRVVIAYTVTESGDIEIGRVLYGGRDYEALIEDETNEPEIRSTTAGGVSVKRALRSTRYGSRAVTRALGDRVRGKSEAS